MFPDTPGNGHGRRRPEPVRVVGRELLVRRHLHVSPGGNLHLFKEREMKRGGGNVSGAEGAKGEDRSSVRKPDARVPRGAPRGRGRRRVWHARRWARPRGSMPSDTMDMNVTEPIHRAV